MLITKPPAHLPLRRQQGFTLVELVITIMVLAVALASVAFVLRLNTEHSSDPLWQSRSIELVQAYTDEIMSRRYDELTPIGGTPPCNPCSAGLGSDAGEARGAGANTFDDVDDYHGINEAPTDAQGNARAGYAGYRINIAVAYAGNTHGTANRNLKQITLTVTPPGQAPLSFTLIRGNY